jgi:Protein of unknown function (DUF2971)
MPPRLYKYRTTESRTDEYFTQRKIWMAKPSTLNDPLDCALKPIDASGRDQRIRQAKVNHLEGFIWQAVAAHTDGLPFFNVSGRDIKRLLTRLKKATDFERKYRMANAFLQTAGTPGFSKVEVHEKYIEEQVQNVGIFSLSEDATNMLMWSHYGQNHTGVVIGFDTSTDCTLSLSGDCEAVQYTDELSEFKFRNTNQMALNLELSPSGETKMRSYIPITEPQIRRALLSKTTPWAYEREWRFIAQQFGSHDLPAKIKELIFGVNCPAPQRDRLKALARESFGQTIDLTECYLAPGTTTLRLRAYA